MERILKLPDSWFKGREHGAKHSSFGFHLQFFYSCHSPVHDVEVTNLLIKGEMCKWHGAGQGNLYLRIHHYNLLGGTGSDDIKSKDLLKSFLYVHAVDFLNVECWLPQSIYNIHFRHGTERNLDIWLFQVQWNLLKQEYLLILARNSVINPWHLHAHIKSDKIVDGINSFDVKNIEH